MLSTAADDIRAWLRARRGAQTQDALAQDITAVTGWNITRDRYSKYETSLPIGPTVLKHFTDYWATKGGPTLEEYVASREAAVPATDPPVDLAEAIRLHAAAITELAAQVKALVEAQPAPTELATALVELVRSGLLGGSPSETPDGVPR